MSTNPTIDDITAAARRSTQTMVRPSRAFWIELLSAFGISRARLDEATTEADLRELAVKFSLLQCPDITSAEDARRRWAKVFGIEVQP